MKQKKNSFFVCIAALILLFGNPVFAEPPTVIKAGSLFDSQSGELAAMRSLSLRATRLYLSAGPRHLSPKKPILSTCRTRLCHPASSICTRISTATWITIFSQVTSSRRTEPRLEVWSMRRRLYSQGLRRFAMSAQAITLTLQSATRLTPARSPGLVWPCRGPALVSRADIVTTTR